MKRIPLVFDTWRSIPAFFIVFIVLFSSSKADVVINELLVHSDVSFYDYIELVNLNETEAADISGWYLSYDPKNLTLYKIPSGTILQPKEYKSFRCEADPSGTGFVLDRKGGDVFVSRTAANGSLEIVDHVPYDSVINHIVMERWINSIGEIDYPLALPTQEFENRYPLVGPFIISEFLLNPNPGEAVYIKITCIHGRSSFDGESVMTGYLAGYEVRFKEHYPIAAWIQNTMNTSEWDFTKTPPARQLPPEITLQKGESIWVVSGDANAFAEKHGVSPSRVYGDLDISRGIDLQSESIALLGGERNLSWFAERVNWRNAAPWPQPPQGVPIERVCETCYANEPSNWRVKDNVSKCDASKGGQDCPFIDQCTSASCNADGECEYTALACNHPNRATCYPEVICHDPAKYGYTINTTTCAIEPHIFGHKLGDIGIWGLYEGNIMYYDAGCKTVPIDCAVSEWSDWSQCDCTGKTQTRTRQVKWDAKDGGAPCPGTSEQQKCLPADNCSPATSNPSPYTPPNTPGGPPHVTDALHASANALHISCLALLAVIALFL